MSVRRVCWVCNIMLLCSTLTSSWMLLLECVNLRSRHTKGYKGCFLFFLCGTIHIKKVQVFKRGSFFKQQLFCSQSWQYVQQMRPSLFSFFERQVIFLARRISDHLLFEKMESTPPNLHILKYKRHSFSNLPVSVFWSFFITLPVNFISDVSGWV